MAVEGLVGEVCSVQGEQERGHECSLWGPCTADDLLLIFLLLLLLFEIGLYHWLYWVFFTSQCTSFLQKGVLLITGLPESGWSESDIIKLVHPFGTPSDIILATKIGKVGMNTFAIT